MYNEYVGRGYYTVREAAKRLNRSPRSVHYYANRGLIRKLKSESGEVVLEKDDVDNLALEQGDGMPVLTRANFAALNSRVKRLEEFSTIVKEIMGLREYPLRFSNVREAETIHRAMTGLTTKEEWSVKDISMWADLFIRFDWQTIEEISRAAKINDPWVSTFKFCRHIREKVDKALKLKPSKELLNLSNKLEVGEKRIRELSILWIESGHSLNAKDVIKALYNTKPDIAKILAL